MSEDAPSAGRIVGLEHRLPVRVYYEDTDFTGRVYHARYLQFLERGRSDFLRQLGVGHVALLERDDPLMFAISRMTLAFKAAARIDDELIVRSRFARATGVRLTIDQAVLLGEETLLEAEVEAVCITPEGRPRRAPREVVEAIRPLAPRSTDSNEADVPK